MYQGNTALVVQEDHYYPFGMRLGGMSTDTGQDNKFLYNGKELDDEYDLDLYYYGARNYNPQLGKWLQIDPADEFNSPYVYCANNPVMFVDPDGCIVTSSSFGGRVAYWLTGEASVGRALGYSDRKFQGLEFQSTAIGGAIHQDYHISSYVSVSFLFGTGDPNVLIGDTQRFGVTGFPKSLGWLKYMGFEWNVIYDNQLNKYYHGASFSFGKSFGGIIGYSDKSKSIFRRNIPYKWESKFYFKTLQLMQKQKNMYMKLYHLFVPFEVDFQEIPSEGFIGPLLYDNSTTESFDWSWK